MYDDIVNWVVISDLHFGCRMGLFPPEGIMLDEGERVMPSDLQLAINSYWREFWDEWVPQVTRKQRYGIIINGDALDGNHHGSVHQVSQNLADQKKIAEAVLEPVIAKAKALYWIRGTEAHVGKSGQNEEELAKRFEAHPNKMGQYARYDLWKRIGTGLVHFLHHIGTTASNAYEGTAVTKELTEEFNEAARWGEEAPQIIIRSHRHRHFKVQVPAKNGFAIAEVTPGWQAKSPFTWKIAGARLAPPQFGGIVIRVGDEELYTRNYTKTIGRSDVE